MSANQIERGASSAERGARRLPSSLLAPRASLRMRPRLPLLTLAATLPLLGACDWFTEFKHQPRIEAWEPLSQQTEDTIRAPRGQPQQSVPVTGTVVAGYQVGYGAFPATLDSLAGIPNPTPPSPASLANGRKYYTINCSVCHGDTGAGNGPTTQNGYGMPQISIISATTQGRTDGYIYGMIRNGRGLMPTYNRIEEMDRWDVVNYVRALQGRIPNTAGLGQVGYPGQNGATVPGHTVTAPTRPVPHWRDTRGPLGGVTPTPSGETPSPAQTQGQSGAPVPPTQNDSGPQGRLRAQPGAQQQPGAGQPGAQQPGTTTPAGAAQPAGQAQTKRGSK